MRTDNHTDKPAGISRIIRKLQSLHTLDVAFLIGLAVVIGVFLYFRSTKKTTWLPVTIMVTPADLWWDTHGVAPWYGADLTAGEASYSTFGTKVAEITNVRNMETDRSRRVVYVTVNLKVNYDQRRKVYLYNFQPITVGSMQHISFDTQQVRGMVTFIGDDTPVVYRKVEAKVQYAYPWTAEVLTPGLESKDSSGKTVARIESAAVTDAADYRFSDWSGRPVVVNGTDNTRRDITMTLTLATKKYNGISYTLDGSIMKVGTSIPLEFPSVSAPYADIVRIID
jgi:hypothetical protein